MIWERRNLFVRGNFVLNSRQYSPFKIDCDAFTEEDWLTCAYLISERVRPFGVVYGIPRGGTPLAVALSSYVTHGPCLIVDDVWTTGGSMRGARQGYEDTHPVMGPSPIGAVVFARGQVDDWVTPLFTLTE